MLLKELLRCLGSAACMAVVIRAIALIPLNRLLFVVVAIPLGALVYGIVHVLSGGTALLEIWEGVREKIKVTV